MKTKNKNILVVLLWIISLLFSSCSSQKTSISASANSSQSNGSNVNNTIAPQNNTPTTNTHAS